MNLLFVCSENKLRSATAEALFSQYDGIQAIGAGTNCDAETPVSGDLIEWADIVFAMEPSHRNKLTQKFSTLLKNKRLVCLGIADRYDYLQPELIEILKSRVAKTTNLQIYPHR